MQNDMETEFIYWRHHTLPGIKVEEVCGAEDKSGALWLDMAYQVYGENGRDGFRDIGHYRNGAPFLNGEECRISITHTKHFLAIATLPPTPEVDLSHFSQRAALGIDAEAEDRAQVLKLREKFLSAEELELISADSLLDNILAWTAKEALYKAALTPEMDWRRDILIKRLPKIGPAVPVYDHSEFDPITPGEAVIRIPKLAEEECVAEESNYIEVGMILYSYRSEGNIVTLAYSPKCAKFGTMK